MIEFKAILTAAILAAVSGLAARLWSRWAKRQNERNGAEQMPAAYQVTVTYPDKTVISTEELDFDGIAEEVYALGCSLDKFEAGMKATIERIR